MVHGGSDGAAEGDAMELSCDFVLRPVGRARRVGKERERVGMKGNTCSGQSEARMGAGQVVKVHIIRVEMTSTLTRPRLDLT